MKVCELVTIGSLDHRLLCGVLGNLQFCCGCVPQYGDSGASNSVLYACPRIGVKASVSILKVTDSEM